MLIRCNVGKLLGYKFCNEFIQYRNKMLAMADVCEIMCDYYFDINNTDEWNVLDDTDDTAFDQQRCIFTKKILNIMDFKRACQEEAELFNLYIKIMRYGYVWADRRWH